MSDMRAIDDAEALRVRSELSELDPKIRGDTYKYMCHGRWKSVELQRLSRRLESRVVRERGERARTEAPGVGGPSATPG
eukprot:4516079-Amphidinium_carterae.1